MQTSTSTRAGGRRAALAAAALAALLAGCGGARPGGAGEGASALRSTTCPAPDTAAIPADDAAIAVAATVRAREVRFADEPRTLVSVRGDSAARASCDVRRGLPRPVRAGETYRDVEVRWRLAVPLDSAGAPADSLRPRP
jgi:hypothetical protein